MQLILFLIPVVTDTFDLALISTAIGGSSRTDLLWDLQKCTVGFLS